MIPGLEISEEVEKRIWERFSDWADHFKDNLKKTGIRGLTEKYNEFVLNLESETCWHSENSSLKEGEWFTECCGISYEYLNDLSVRKAIEFIIDEIPDKTRETIIKRLDPIDQRLKALLGDNRNMNKEYNKKYPKEKYWWLYGLPRTVKP